MQVPDVRKATVDDAPQIARIHVLSWQVAYRGHMPDDFLDALDVAKRTNMWREWCQNPNMSVFVVDDDNGNVLGFSIVIASRDSDARSGTAELGAIYVHPEKWGKGLGRALLSQSLEKARERGFDEVTLWVLEDNERARRFYEASGFTWDGNLQTVNRPEGFTIRDVRYFLKL